MTLKLAPFSYTTLVMIRGFPQKITLCLEPMLPHLLILEPLPQRNLYSLFQGTDHSKQSYFQAQVHADLLGEHRDPCPEHGCPQRLSSSGSGPTPAEGMKSVPD